MLIMSNSYVFARAGPVRPPPNEFVLVCVTFMFSQNNKAFKIL